jgi:TATA-binding protein-associated factor Taf7
MFPGGRGKMKKKMARDIADDPTFETELILSILTENQIKFTGTETEEIARETDTVKLLQLVHHQNSNSSRPLSINTHLYFWKIFI